MFVSIPSAFKNMLKDISPPHYRVQAVMDLSKAFDKVHHPKLFAKLVEKGLPPIICRLLMAMYRNQEVNVKWNGKDSNYFKIYNGVKQGAILSPQLFSIYIDNLFSTLRRREIGR